MTATAPLPAALAAATGTDPADWRATFKARYAMASVLSSIAADAATTTDAAADAAAATDAAPTTDAASTGTATQPPRTEVVTQLFTCATAVDPILSAGLTPRYAEVSPDTVALDPERLRLAPTTAVVVLQHTFGIVDPVRSRQLRELADRAGALLLEDSAHCATELARDEDGRPLADLSLHSFGSEKLLPTRFGGAIWVNPALRTGPRAALHTRLLADLDALPAPGTRLDLVTRAYRTQLRIINRLPAALATRVRRLLTGAGLFEPPIAPVEQQGRLAHAPLGTTEWIESQATRALESLDSVLATRRAAVAVYLDELAGVVQIPAGIAPGSALIRFPYFALDAAAAEQAIAALRAAGAHPGLWYRPALFPGVTNPALYGFTPGEPQLRVTEDLIARVVNLPTNVPAGEARRIAGIVREVTNPQR